MVDETENGYLSLMLNTTCKGISIFKNGKRVMHIKGRRKSNTQFMIAIKADRDFKILRDNIIRDDENLGGNNAI